MPELSGVTALVTGASSGLGRRFSLALAEAGAAVAVAARRMDRLEALVGDIAAAGGAAVPIALDVTDEGSVEAAFDAAEARLGPITAVVNNAGINVPGLAVDLSMDAFDAIFAANVRGVFMVAREGARRMIARDQRRVETGRIVNIASIGGLTVLPGLTAYCSAKAAVVMMTRSLAREWARQGVCVNAICPGYVETEINADWLAQEGGQRMVQGFPRRRLMRAEDLDAMITFLCGPASRFVTGSIFTIDDGQSL